MLKSLQLRNSAHNPRSAIIRAARTYTDGLYGLDAVADDHERQDCIVQLIQDNTFSVRGADRLLPVEVSAQCNAWRAG
jgi:hypothetical protein